MISDVKTVVSSLLACNAVYFGRASAQFVIGCHLGFGNLGVLGLGSRHEVP